MDFEKELDSMIKHFKNNYIRGNNKETGAGADAGGLHRLDGIQNPPRSHREAGRPQRAGEIGDVGGEAAGFGRRRGRTGGGGKADLRGISGRGDHRPAPALIPPRSPRGAPR